jgi:hypothetical protein
MPEESGSAEQALGIASRVEKERGQWVVFLDVSFWNEEPEDQPGYNPIKVVRKRINTYPTQARAELAASFMVRAAARYQPHPPLGY